MLNKLLKYEIKATGRLFVPLYLTILLFAVINKLPFRVLSQGADAMNFRSILSTLTMIVYITLIIGMIVMTMVVLIQRFYKSLLGDEGYLMFTLPVKSWQHILSKLFISMLWTILSGIVGLLSIFVIAFDSKFIPVLKEGFSMLSNVINEYLGAWIYTLSIQALISVILSLASSILIIYASISLGHLFNKYKLLASFGMYIALSTLGQIIGVTLTSLFKDSLFKFDLNTQFTGIPPTTQMKTIAPIEQVMMDGGDRIGFMPTPEQIHAILPQVQTILLFSILISAFLSAGYFVLTQYILSKKLNLE